MEGFNIYEEWISADKFLKITVLKKNNPHIWEKAESSTTFKDNTFLKSKFSIKLRSVFVSFDLSSTSNKIKLLSYHILSHDCQQKKQFLPYFLYCTNMNITGLTRISSLVKTTITPQVVCLKSGPVSQVYFAQPNQYTGQGKQNCWLKTSKFKL